MNIHELAKKHEAYCIEMRHYFHMHPELGLHEENTSKVICEELEKMGIPYEVVGCRNVVGKMEFTEDGPQLAIRADIDALPMEEEIESEYKSQVPGVMHACGHDSHAATLLATAKCLCEMKEELTGTVYLCFQVAEEISGGGPQDITKYLKALPKGCDMVIGNHISAALPVGVAITNVGPVFAGNCQWRITVTGKGGHGSRPDLSIDPIRPLAQIVGQVTSIPSNYFNPYEPLVISPCMIHGGTAYNIIPDEAYIEGNLRYFHMEDLDKILAKMGKIAQNTADSFGCTAKIEKIAYCPPVENNKEVTERAIKAMGEIGATYVPLAPANMGSDDFSFMTSEIPGCYVMFGARSDRPEASTNHHNTKFFLDEKGFAPVVEFFTQYAYDLLKK